MRRSGCLPGGHQVPMCVPPESAQNFCIPHGRRRVPVWGRSALQEHLAPFLPGHRLGRQRRFLRKLPRVSARPFGRVPVFLPIFLRLHPSDGGRGTHEGPRRWPFLNVNYIKARLAGHYETCSYTGKKNGSLCPRNDHRFASLQGIGGASRSPISPSDSWITAIMRHGVVSGSRNHDD